MKNSLKKMRNSLLNLLNYWCIELDKASSSIVKKFIKKYYVCKIVSITANVKIFFYVTFNAKK